MNLLRDTNFSEFLSQDLVDYVSIVFRQVVEVSKLVLEHLQGVGLAGDHVNNSLQATALGGVASKKVTEDVEVHVTTTTCVVVVA